MKKITVILLLLIFTTGCAGYWINRKDDFADIGKASVGVSFPFEFIPGPGIDIQATDFFHPSFGYKSTSANIGHESRYISGVWFDTSSYYPYTFSLELSLDRHLRGPFDYGVIERSKFIGQKYYYLGYMEGYIKNKRIEVSMIKRLGFEVGINAVLINARVGVNPAEILDFILGFTALDIAGDDAKSVLTKDEVINEEKH